MSSLDRYLNKITCMDCLDLMKELPDESIDCIITDPPYGTTACEWDSIIPFEPMWKQLKRITKKSGAIVLFGSQPFVSALVISNPKMFKYEWIWNKKRPFGFLDSKFRPMKKHESITVFSFAGCSNGSKPAMKYNPQGLIYSPRINKRRKGNILNSEPKLSVTQSDYTNYPNTILEFGPDKNTGHPTQKPVALMEYLIKTYTNEGDLVLDFACGSGTTAVACMQTNRQYIGFEISQKYVDMANKRLKPFKEQGRIELPRQPA